MFSEAEQKILTAGQEVAEAKAALAAKEALLQQQPEAQQASWTGLQQRAHQEQRTGADPETAGAGGSTEPAKRCGSGAADAS